MPNNTQIVIVKANLDHLSSLKKISDKNRKQLGFIPRAKFQEAINSGRVYVALANDEVVGFVNFRHRKTDLQTTLSEICVVTDLREQGIGKQLLRALQIECEALSRSWIQLKCPVDLSANIFYENLGFLCISTEKGKIRPLNVWRYPLDQRK